MRAYGDFAIGAEDVDRRENLFVDILNKGFNRFG